MSNYPITLDDDSTIFRIDDNLSELGSDVINQLREAVFAIQGELGTSPSGSVGSVVNRLNVSLNADGTIKSSALSSVGLVTLPIDNAQVGVNAGIEESKLDLDYATSSLNTRLSAAETLLNSLATFASSINSNLRTHVAGGSVFDDGALARHVASHIDLNAVPSDPRDVSYNWSGLQDKDGVDRSADTVAEALDEINTALTTHENATEDAHPATSITVDTANFFELSSDADTVQKALDELDDAETLRMGLHRATMHDNGVNRTARADSTVLDGYGQNIVPPTLARAFHIESPAVGPNDNNVNGDDLIAFMPTNTNFVFDSQFAQVKPGDIIRINYGTGFEGTFTVDEIRHNPDSEWVVRINNINLCSTDGYTCFARIDRPLFTDNTAGVFACAAANNDINTNILSSIVIGNPRGAMALGNGFEPSQLDGYHYNLYLGFYPTGDPSEKTINLPAIDVTGDQGARPGSYTLEGIVQATNDAFRAAGYNYRFIAFSHKGNFGIMLADYIDNASFSIINGSVSGTSLIEGSFTENVIGDAIDGRDALGLGGANAGWASPNYTGTFTNEGSASNLYTRVISPLKSRNAIINGVRRDDFPETYAEIGDGYWAAEITSVTTVSSTTVEVTYTVDRDLSNANLAVGKTIVVAPLLDVNDGSYLVQDYGRFIIKSVTFTNPCGDVGSQTLITVVNGVHGTGDVDDTVSAIGLDVRLYFSDDSVSFNQSHVIDAIINAPNFLRVHEIYLDEEGHSFSHERARMPKQNGTSSLLDTDSGWSFRRVSSKLTGYRDDETSTNFHRYLRLFIINYDSDTGEFDGYVGKRVVGLDSITNFGRVVRSRKNQPVRFYDQTNIDYIEVQFTETGSTSTSIDFPRYVDIEIFPSIAENDEYFKLASCELNELDVVNVIDEREFGTVSEKNLSTSAIKFIEAGDRLLHGNGVFYGLDYAGVDTADSTSGLLFNGGSALVNGKVVTANHAKVNIPLLDADRTINFGICLDINGNFVPVAFSRDTFNVHHREEVFVQDETETNTYFIRSSTFEELTSTESDLVLLAVVNVNANSVPITINSVSDARKFILNETSHITLVWAENDDGRTNEEGFTTKGHFTSFEQLKTWINFSSVKDYLVKIKGEIVIDSAVDLTEINTEIFGIGDKRVIFDGSEGCTITVLSDLGIKLNDHFTFKNIRFRYRPPTDASGASTGVLHLDSDVGCLYGVKCSGLEVIDCIFRCDVSGQERFPFINIRTDGFTQTVTQNVRLIGNKFYDGGSTSINPAIAFSTINSGTLRDVLIENNYMNSDQDIVIINSFSKGDTFTGGLTCVNVVIRDNFAESAGSIGYMVISSTSELDSLIIEKNTVSAILCMDDQGEYVSDVYDGYNVINYTDVPNGTGNVIIRDNFCRTIDVICMGNGSSGVNNIYSSVLIDSNKIDLRSEIGADLVSVYGFPSGDIPGISISQVIDINFFPPSFNAIISNNRIQGSNSSGTPVLREGILCFNCNANIVNNNISGFSEYGIVVAFNNYVNSDGYAIIKNNQIFRYGNSITRYINATTGRCIVTDNIIDSTTIDNSSTLTIATTTATYVMGNVNQLRTLSLGLMESGQWSWLWFSNLASAVVDNMLIGYTTASSTSITIDTGGQFGGSPFGTRWVIGLEELIPPGARLLGLSISYSATAADWTSGLAVLSVLDNSSGSVLEVDSGDFATNDTDTITISDINSGFGIVFGSRYTIELELEGARTGGSATTFTLSRLTATYTF